MLSLLENRGSQRSSIMRLTWSINRILVAAYLPFRSVATWIALAVVGLIVCSEAQGQVLPSLAEAEPAYLAGNYELALEQSRVAIERGIWNEKWYLLGIRTAMTLGQRETADTFLQAGLTKFASSIQLRWLGAQLYREAGRKDDAAKLLAEIADLSERAAWRYTDRANRTVMARYLLDQGSDPKVVLQDMLDRVKTQDPKFVDAYLATAELALSKHDYQMAADELQEAIQIDASNPELFWRLGQAFLPSDPGVAMSHWQHCLELNPKFVPCLLSLADRAIDGENRGLAETLLDQVQSINPNEPTQYIYRSLLSFLDGDLAAYEQWRSRALDCSPDNPHLYHLLGRKLSQKYHFAEGVEYQRRAIELDPLLEPAQLQLGQDLLRLGDDSGWELIEQVRSRDPFQVTAFNLTQLQSELAKFETLETPDFVVRMTARDAELYGEEVIEILEAAKTHLEARYDYQLPGPVLVEIFARPSDFAVRTFGVPGVDGYLGVCFGQLITVSGPAEQSPPETSWQSVLWHELTHSYTLGKSHHRIPRWLSEGLSVREEGLRDPAWQRSSGTAERERILSEDSPAVSQLSELFLKPQSSEDIGFAYFLSGWVAEFLEQESGIEGIQGLLADLGTGLSFEEAIGRRWGSMESVDQRFAEYARRRALTEGLLDPAMAPHFESLFASDEDPESVAELRELHSGATLQRTEIEKLELEEQREEAIQRLRELDAELPAIVERSSIWLSLLRLSRETTQPEIEREILLKIIRDGSYETAILDRASELAEAASDLESLQLLAHKRFEIDPLSASTHQLLANTSIARNEPKKAVTALQRLLTFPNSNLLQTRVQLAEQWIAIEEWESAEKQLVLVLLQAPRAREVLRLYQQVRESTAQDSVPEPASPPLTLPDNQ